MQRSKIWTFATAILALASTPALADKPEFALPSMATFDGVHFGPLTLGTTTASDVKGSLKIDKNGANSIPWSLRLSTPKGGGYRVFAIFSGPSDKTDTLNAVLVQYEAGPSLDAVRSDFGEKGQDYYQTDRNSDWSLVDFADKGVVAFVKDIERGSSVPAELIMSPEVLKDGFLDLSTTPTEIVPVPDLHARDPKVAPFGNIDISTSGLSGDLKLRDEQVDDIRDDVKLAGARGTIYYDRHDNSGSYNVDLSGDYKWDKGGSVTVTVTISGMSPYGPISAKADATKNLDKNKNVRDYNYYRGALHDARADAEVNFANAMMKAGPPTPADTRRVAWDDNFNAVRQHILEIQRVTVKVPPAQPFISFLQ